MSEAASPGFTSDCATADYCYRQAKAHLASMSSPLRSLHPSDISLDLSEASRGTPVEGAASCTETCFHSHRTLSICRAMILYNLSSYFRLLVAVVLSRLLTFISATTASLSVLRRSCDHTSVRLASGRSGGHTSGRNVPRQVLTGGSSSLWGSGHNRSLRGSASAYPLPSGRIHQIMSTVNSSGDARTYTLEVVQQPETTAEFGNAALSRLPIAPPLFVQLIIRDLRGNIVENEPDLPFFIAHLSLYSADGMTLLDEQRGSGVFPPDRLLYGNIVSSPHSLRNLHGSPGIYFLFPDVSVRYRGQYSLRVSLMRLSSMDASGMVRVGQSGSVLTYTQTRPFEVRDRATYVAPPQTPLTEFFLQQGARMYAFQSSQSRLHQSPF